MLLRLRKLEGQRQLAAVEEHEHLSAVFLLQPECLFGLAGVVFARFVGFDHQADFVDQHLVVLPQGLVFLPEPYHFGQADAQRLHQVPHQALAVLSEEFDVQVFRGVDAP